MRRIAPTLTLYFLAPLVAEFFLGDFPITYLALILALAPMYGAGALLIREFARRTGRGWPAIVVMALAYGVLEEGLLTQSLFNPDYANAHLLTDGFVPSLGIAIPWTIFVLTLHTVWSISTPIALVEESTLGRRTQPWMRTPGTVAAIVLFLIGCVFTFAVSYRDKHFMASPAQLVVSAAVFIALVIVALLLPKPGDETGHRAGHAPSRWVVFGCTIVAGVAFMGSDELPVWVGVAVMLLAEVAMIGLIARWSAQSGWGAWHRFALAAGALLTYSWHGFTMTPVQGKGVALNLVSHIIYALGALAILWYASSRVRKQPSTVPTVEPALINA